MTLDVLPLPHSLIVGFVQVDALIHMIDPIVRDEVMLAARIWIGLGELDLTRTIEVIDDAQYACRRMPALPCERRSRLRDVRFAQNSSCILLPSMTVAPPVVGLQVAGDGLFQSVKNPLRYVWQRSVRLVLHVFQAIERSIREPAAPQLFGRIIQSCDDRDKDVIVKYQTAFGLPGRAYLDLFKGYPVLH
jgi:hypothetical protein